MWTLLESVKQGNNRRRLTLQDCWSGVFSIVARFLWGKCCSQEKNSPIRARRRHVFSRGCQCFSRGCRFCDYFTVASRAATLELNVCLNVCALEVVRCVGLSCCVSLRLSIGPRGEGCGIRRRSCVVVAEATLLGLNKHTPL